MSRAPYLLLTLFVMLLFPFQIHCTFMVLEQFLHDFSTYCGAVFRSDLSEVIQTPGRAITVGYQAKLKFPKVFTSTTSHRHHPIYFPSHAYIIPENLGPNKSPSLFESRETNGSSVGKHGLQRFSRAQRLSFRPAVAKVTELCWGFHQSWKSSCTGHDGILMGFSVMFWWRLTLKKNRWLHQVGTPRCWWGENTHCPTPLPLTGIAMPLWCPFFNFTKSGKSWPRCWDWLSWSPINNGNRISPLIPLSFSLLWWKIKNRTLIGKAWKRYGFMLFFFFKSRTSQYPMNSIDLQQARSSRGNIFLIMCVWQLKPLFRNPLIAVVRSLGQQPCWSRLWLPSKNIVNTGDIVNTGGLFKLALIQN